MVWGEGIIDSEQCFDSYFIVSHLFCIGMGAHKLIILSPFTIVNISTVYLYVLFIVYIFRGATTIFL